MKRNRNSRTRYFKLERNYTNISLEKLWQIKYITMLLMALSLLNVLNILTHVIKISISKHLDLLIY